MTVNAKPANPKSTNPKASRRGAMIAKIHIAQTQMGLDDATYRALLVRATGKDSCAKCNPAELTAILDAFKGAGWKDKSKRTRATAPMLSKITALWLSLYQLGELDDPGDDALAKFAARSTASDNRPDGVRKLDWLTPDDCDLVIRALRGWCERVGFIQPRAADLEAYTRWRIGSLAGADQNPVDMGLAARFKLLAAQWRRIDHYGGFKHGMHAHLGNWLSKYFGASAEYFLDEAKADAAIARLGVWVRTAKKQKKMADAARGEAML